MRSMHFVFLPALILLAAPLLAAQSAASAMPAPAPIPAPILSAHTVFIGNAGMDAFADQVFGELGLTDTEPYDALYAAMKSWGRYQLVDSPAGADLVFEIRSTAPFTTPDKEVVWDFQHIVANSTWQFQNSVAIYDGKTHFLLWTITQPIRPAALAGTWRKNILAANDNLLAQFKSLLIATPPANP